MPSSCFRVLSNPHGCFQQGFSVSDYQSWTSSTSTFAHPSRTSSKSKLNPNNRFSLLLHMASELSPTPRNVLLRKLHSRGRVTRPVSIVSPLAPSLPTPSIDMTAMRDPCGAVRTRVTRSPLSSAEERTWLSFSSLGCPPKTPKQDRHAVMAAHSPRDSAPAAAHGVIDSPRAALSARQTWLVLQNVDRGFFRAHGAAVARGALKLGVVHESASVKLFGCRVTVARWHRAVWFEAECEHFEDPLAGTGTCSGSGPCALELHEFVRIDRNALSRVPRPIKAAWGYYKYVPQARSE